MSNSSGWDALYASRVDRMNVSAIRELLKVIERPDVISFAGGIPEPALFPVELIRRGYLSILADGNTAGRALQYSVSEGYQPLRIWLCRYMKALGVLCDPSNIIITCGSQQALDFAGKILLSPDDAVIIEEPTYVGAIQAFNVYEPRYRSLKLETNPGGSANLSTYARVDEERAKFVYVVPDFSNPTGRTLNLEERETLLSMTDEMKIPIIEDAAYSALRYTGAALPSLLAMDVARSGSIDKSRVVYCGTFSKTLAPALRTGWVCASRELVDKFVLAKQASDLHNSNINQMMTHWLVNNAYEQHLMDLLAVYRERRDCMLEALANTMPGNVSWTTPDGGLFVWVTLPDWIDGKKLLDLSITEARVAFVPGVAFHPARSRTNTLRLSFSCADNRQIWEGVRRLGKLLEPYCAAQRMG